MANKGQRIQDLVGLVHTLYDPFLAEEWDNTGLQVGDPVAPVERVLVALDPGIAAINAARELEAQALVTHHPLLFHPVKRLTPDDAVGQVLWAAICSGVAIISAHTNLDSAANGLNCWLAERLGVENALPLEEVSGNYVKLVTYVPITHEDQVADALFAGGGGKIGVYDQCSFRVQGRGTFRPGDEANPFLGRSGTMEQVEEIRLETIVPKNRLAKVLEKMNKAHPYEEVAYDLFPLMNHLPGVGMGRIGTVNQPMTLEAFSDSVKKNLGCDQLRLSGPLTDKKIHKVAVCSGSGSGLLLSAHRQGADILVTGDVKYHDARRAEELGLVLMDAGHFATEKIMIEMAVETLKKAATKRHWTINFEAYRGEQDPFRTM